MTRNAYEAYVTDGIVLVNSLSASPNRHPYSACLGETFHVDVDQFDPDDNDHIGAWSFGPWTWEDAVLYAQTALGTEDPVAYLREVSVTCGHAATVPLADWEAAFYAEPVWVD